MPRVLAKGWAVIRLRNPSLEFNWLPNSIRKGLSTPRVVLSNRIDCGGFYCNKTPERYIHPWLGMDVSEAPVVAVTELAGSVAASLAHEYRHHWQWNNFGHRMRPSVWDSQNQDYKASIVRYFRTYWWEMDALKFELKHAPNDVSRLWWEWLMETPRLRQ